MADEKPLQSVTEMEEDGRKSTDSKVDNAGGDNNESKAEMKEFGTGTETFEEKDTTGETQDKITDDTSQQNETTETKEDANADEVNENSNANEEEKPADGPDESKTAEVTEDASERPSSQQSTPAADQPKDDVEEEKKDDEKEDKGEEEDKGDKEQTIEEGDTEGEKDESKPADGEEPVDSEQKQEQTEAETEPGETAEGDVTEVKETEEPTEGETDITPKTDDQVVEGETTEKVQSPIPKSDTFDEGERTESPVAVGQKLSREATPVRFDVREVTIAESIEPGTPDGSAIDEEEEYQEEEEDEPEPEFDREALIERYNAAIAEREQMQQQNYALQHKLAEYFRKKKSDESRQDYDKNVTDQEQRYLKYMAQLEDLRKQESHEKENYQRHIEDWKEKCEDKKSRVDDERTKFMHFKKEVALNALNSRSGKPIIPKDIEQYLSALNKKETDVEGVRLENIKLKNKLRKKELQLKSKEELAEGLHLIDFEQLKIENQTYNEKIEERNEELLKLRKKITSTVQVLTHLKEKLQFVQAENQIQKKNLHSVEAYVAQKRDVLSRTKQARDALRNDNQKLRQNCGLLGNEPLLRDFEGRKDEGDDLRSKLESLKMEHAELTLNCNQVRRKIEQAKNGGRA